MKPEPRHREDYGPRQVEAAHRVLVDIGQVLALKAFRVLQAEGCSAAFHAPEDVELTGKMVMGARNRVRLRVTSLPDFLVMKAHAIAGRDKPKDTYDLCYCLEYSPAESRSWPEPGRIVLKNRM